MPKPQYFITNLTVHDAKELWPDTEGFFLRGNTFGHPRFRDGEPIRTSLLVSTDPEKGHFETKNSIYIKVTDEEAQAANMLGCVGKQD